jgi:hypothetical protein
MDGGTLGRMPWLRVGWLLVVANACRKDTAGPLEHVEPRAAPPPAVVTDARAADASASIDLLRAVPATVRVSSRVNNKQLLPEHLVDRRLDTAWNSATGDLVGAWIDVRFDRPVQIDEVRVTAGFTGSGPKGEDYFTMNPRIRRIVVTSDGRHRAT